MTKKPDRDIRWGSIEGVFDDESILIKDDVTGELLPISSEKSKEFGVQQSAQQGAKVTFEVEKDENTQEEKIKKFVIRQSK